MNQEDKERINDLDARIMTGDLKAKIEWASLFQMRLFNEVTPEIAERIVRYYEEGIGKYDVAALNLGALYYNGVLVPRDFAKAVQYYQMAADAEDDWIAAIACADLGYCYAYGREIPKDMKKAYESWLKGTERAPYSVNFYKLGDMYRFGNYVEKDAQKAFEYYEKAYEAIEKREENREVRGDILKRLGECWLYGTGTPVNVDKALDFLKEAKDLKETDAENGDPFAEGIADKIQAEIETAESKKK